MDRTEIFNISEFTSHLSKQNEISEDALLPDEITIKEEPLDELLESSIRPMEFLDLGSSQIKLESFEAVPVERRIVQDPLAPDDFEIKIENLEDENFVERIVQDPLASDDIEIKIENLEDENFGNLTSDQCILDENGTVVSAVSNRDESSYDRLSRNSNCLPGCGITEDYKELDQPSIKNTINNLLADSSKPCGFNNESTIDEGFDLLTDCHKNQGLLVNNGVGKVTENLISLNHLEHSHKENNKINVSIKAKKLSDYTDRSKAARRCKVSLDFQINIKPSNISRRSRNSLLSALDSETEPNNFKEILEKLLVPETSMVHQKVGKSILKTSETGSVKSSHNLFEQRRFKSKKIISAIRKDETAQCANKTFLENEIKFVELSGKMIPIKRCYVLLERLQVSESDLLNDKEYPGMKMTCISDISNKESKLISLQLYKDISKISDSDSQYNNKKRRIKSSHFDPVKLKKSSLEASINSISKVSECSIPSDSQSTSSSASIIKNQSFQKDAKETESKVKNISSCKRLKKKPIDVRSDMEGVKVTELEALSVAETSPQSYSPTSSDKKDTSMEKGRYQEQPDSDSDSDWFLGWSEPFAEEKVFDYLHFSIDQNDSISDISDSLSTFCQAGVTVNMEDNGKMVVTRNIALFKHLKIKINDWLISMSDSNQNIPLLKDRFPAVLKKNNITISPTYRNNRSAYSCLFCDYVTYIKKFFYKHLWNHIIWYKCQFCSFIHQVLYNIKHHLLCKHYSLLGGIAVEKKKPYACDTCGFRFISKHKLVRHLKSHDDQKVKFICRICGYLGRRLISTESGALTLGKQDLIDHMMKVHQEKLYKCNICSYSSNENYVIDHHVKSVHKKIKLFSCEKCNFRSTNNSSLMKHVTLVHDKIKAFTCHICNLKMGLKSTLDKHLLNIHYKQNMLYCQLCPYSTPRKQDLEVHRYNKHTVKEKKYICYYCPFGTTNKRGVKLHIKRKHDLKKPYFCIYCKFKTSSTEDLKKHITRHEEENPFKCSLCSYTTKVKCHLKQHMPVHSGQKPFTCFHCHQRFTRKGQMKRHIELKHIEKDLAEVAHQAENPQTQNSNNSSIEAFPVQLNTSFQKDLTELVENLVHDEEKEKENNLPESPEKPISIC